MTPAPDGVDQPWWVIVLGVVAFFVVCTLVGKLLANYWNDKHDDFP